jgi:hypothetical protein
MILNEYLVSRDEKFNKKWIKEKNYSKIKMRKFY